MPKGDKGVRGKDIMQWELSSGTIPTVWVRRFLEEVA